MLLLLSPLLLPYRRLGEALSLRAAAAAAAAGVVAAAASKSIYLFYLAYAKVVGLYSLLSAAVAAFTSPAHRRSFAHSMLLFSVCCCCCCC